MNDITYYIFRVNGEVVSSQTYNGAGSTDYTNYATPPSGYDNQQGFSLEWNYDWINSTGVIVVEQNGNYEEFTFYYDATYFYNDPNYVTCNFLYADNGEFASITAVNGNATSNVIGFGAYYRNSIVSITTHPRPGYSITGIDPNYEGTWTTNKVYRLPIVEGARIIWKDYDGRTIRTDYVTEGNTPTPPTVSRTGYTFTGWDPSVVPVTGDATYTAQYTINYYTVRFFSDPGVIFDQSTLPYGTNLIVGTNPTKQDYNFVRWNPTPTTVTQDQDFYAVWEKTTFTIRYYDEETLLHTDKVNKGNSLPTYTPAKSGWRFKNWTPSLVSPVYDDADYYASWNKLYTVQFLDSDEVTIISSNDYILGENIIVPTPPVKPHYRFTGWTPPTIISECAGDATYIANYQLYSTTLVRFYNIYGILANQQSVYIDGIFANEDLTLKELELMGVVPPTMPDIGNNAFLEWIKHDTSYDSSNYTVIYNFYARYMDMDLGTNYCDDQLDTIQRGIDNHSNNINLHIANQNDKLNKGETLVEKLNNIDNSIIDEINLVKAGNRSNSNKLLLLKGQNFDEQFSYLYADISDFQDEVINMNNEHINELRNINNVININEDKMNIIQDKLYSYPKHEIMTKDEYQHLPSYDPSIIYFTKET